MNLAEKPVITRLISEFQRKRAADRFIGEFAFQPDADSEGAGSRDQVCVGYIDRVMSALKPDGHIGLRLTDSDGAKLRDRRTKHDLPDEGPNLACVYHVSMA